MSKLFKVIMTKWYFGGFMQTKCQMTTNNPMPLWKWERTGPGNVGQHHCSLPKLTHWGRVTHICVSKLTIIASDNGLSPGRRQAIIWTNDGLLLIWPLGTNFSEILIEIHSFSFKKMDLETSAKRRPFCLGLNVLRIDPWCDEFC